MFKGLFRRLWAHDTTPAELMSVVMTLKRQQEALRDDLELAVARIRKTEGRVYALWGRKKPELFEQAEPEAPGATPLTDPRLTKDQLRARLLPHGKRFKHTN